MDVVVTEDFSEGGPSEGKKQPNDLTSEFSQKRGGAVGA